MTDQPTRYAVKSPQDHGGDLILGLGVGAIVEFQGIYRVATSTLVTSTSLAVYAAVKTAEGEGYLIHPNSLFPLADDLWVFEDEEGDMMRNLASPDRVKQISLPTLRSMEDASGEKFRLKLHRQRGGAWECVQALPSGLMPES